VHWCAKAGTTRVQVATRGLVTLDDNTREELLPDKWHWRTLTIDDRHHVSRRRPDVAPATSMRYRPPVAVDSEASKGRATEYQRTHGFFPVADTFPAMLPGQSAEVHLRIARHPSKDRKPEHELRQVTWSGGHQYFPSLVVTADDDPEFRATFAYYGGALLQAELLFADGSSCLTHVYVPLLTTTAAQDQPERLTAQVKR
jgi:hypothetical protein